jgi:hypothetical protein
MPYCEINGDLFLTESRLCFVANEKNNLFLMVSLPQTSTNSYFLKL